MPQKNPQSPPRSCFDFLTKHGRRFLNGLVFHIVSGHSFFTGVALVIIAILASTGTRPVLKRVSVLCFFIGILAVVLSSTAMAAWMYAAAVITTMGWLLSFLPALRKRWHPRAAYVATGIWLACVGAELPYHFLPALRPAADRQLAVIGDSVTAGVGGDEESERWPSILARQHQLDVQDISHMGETAASALKRVKRYDVTASVLLLEIGGNDVLGSTTPHQFADDLDALLKHVAADGRQVVMFELPLPPFYHEFGYVQRRLAAKYNVRLVPKRVFLSVIAGKDSTLDSIHLSQAGHRKMADCVWELVQAAFE